MKNKLMIVMLLAALCFSNSAASAPSKKQLLSPADSLSLLETIKDKAIVYGSGEKEVHSFIDPLCSLSRRYLEFIFKKQDMMFKKYTIYLYLYELPSKHSKQTINTILSSEYKNTMLKSVMLNNYDLKLEDIDEDTQESVDEIADIAKKIGVYKRPYIMINGRVK